LSAARLGNRAPGQPALTADIEAIAEAEETEPQGVVTHGRRV